MIAKNTLFAPQRTLNCNGKLLSLEKPIVMAILNMTPDSFYDGGRYEASDAFKKQVNKLVEEGADLIDIGGMSSRPGAEIIPIEEEISRVLPALKYIRSTFPDLYISIDTIHARVAEAVAAEGAHIINDISGGHYDSEMLSTVARLKMPYVLMHMRGTPETMNSMTDYDNLVQEIVAYFSAQIEKCRAAGIIDIIIDPGFGFAKTVDQNFELLNRMGDLRLLGLPILAGISRKSMIWRTLGVKSDDALNGTSVLNTVALQNGADILRVHDVKEAKETIMLVEKLATVQ